MERDQCVISLKKEKHGSFFSRSDNVLIDDKVNKDLEMSKDEMGEQIFFLDKRIFYRTFI